MLIFNWQNIDKGQKYLREISVKEKIFSSLSNSIKIIFLKFVMLFFKLLFGLMYNCVGKTTL